MGGEWVVCCRSCYATSRHAKHRRSASQHTRARTHAHGGGGGGGGTRTEAPQAATGACVRAARTLYDVRITLPEHEATHQIQQRLGPGRRGGVLVLQALPQRDGALHQRDVHLPLEVRRPDDAAAAVARTPRCVALLEALQPKHPQPTRRALGRDRAACNVGGRRQGVIAHRLHTCSKGKRARRAAHAEATTVPWPPRPTTITS